jgi:thymidylate kinase
MVEYQAIEMARAIRLSYNRLVIVDRHWLSERIYAKVFRGGSPWPDMGEIMHQVWIAHDAIYVLCLPYTIEGAIQRHHENLDSTHPYDDVKFTEVLQEYLDFAESVSNDIYFSKYRIETDGKNMTEFTKWIIGRLLCIQNMRAHPW